jgi:septal ring factor EnvC (AmiA/AmiB activator)
LVAFLLIAALPAWAQQATVDATIEENAENLAAIEQQVEALERDLRAREERRDRLYAELEQSERDISALARGGRQLDAMVAEQHAALVRLRAQLEQVRGELAGARAVLAQLLRSAHAMGRGDRLRLLLNQEDLTRSGRLFGYYRALGQKRARQIALVDQQAKRLEGLGQQAAAEAERLAELARRQEDTRQRLSEAQRERTRIVAELERAIVAGRDRMESLRENAARLRELASELSRHSEIGDVFHLDQESLATRRGQLPWPLRETRVLSGFRPRASGDLHGDGVLLAATPGAEVHAVHGGQVVYADWLRGFGLLLVIDHHDGYMSIYGHNQSLLKEPGEWVGSGETIALAGVSGDGKRDGLYFALRHRGEPLDPRLWCAQRIR